MNIFIHEMKMHRNSIVIWSISISATILLFIGVFPAMEKNISNMVLMIENFPKEFIKAFNVEIMLLGTVLGFYSFIFIYATLLGSIQAMRYGLSVLSIEEREKTADFLISKPVSRNKIIISKILAVITSILITNIVFFIVSYLMVNKFTDSNLDNRLFVMITLSLFFIQLVFMSIGLLISMIPRKIKAVTPISMGVVFGFFIIQLFSSAFEDKKLEYFTPFKYFDPEYIIKNQSYNMTYVLLAIGVVIVSLGFTYYRYMKKDMAQI